MMMMMIAVDLGSKARNFMYACKVVNFHEHIAGRGISDPCSAHECAAL